MICPSCSTNFNCMASAECWCADLPPIFDSSQEKCLCKNCLIAVMKDQIKEYTEHLNPEKIDYVQSLGEPAQLIEGIDYYMNEHGLMVFTTWFHLRKGYCCNNKCLHCPYDKIDEYHEN